MVLSGRPSNAVLPQSKAWENKMAMTTQDATLTVHRCDFPGCHTQIKRFASRDGWSERGDDIGEWTITSLKGLLGEGYHDSDYLEFCPEHGDVAKLVPLITLVVSRVDCADCNCKS